MRHLSLTLLTAALLPWSTTTVAMAADPAVVPASGPAPMALFDGKTLTGWEGETKHWSIKDGAITGTIAPDEKLGGNLFLWWSGEVADFDLTLEYRITGDPSANSGIQFRSERFPNGHAKGYQADLDMGDTWLGRIYDEDGRALLTERGQRVAIAPDGRKWTDTFAPLDGFKAVPKRGEWNTYRVRATASHMTTWINGTLMSVLDDRQANAAKFVGHLGLQLHSGPGPATIQYRNLQFINLGKTEFTHAQIAQAAAPAGITVNGDDGKPLNLDLEKGTIDGWTATGDAWQGQPIEGDTVTPRKPGQASKHAGKFWVGGYEKSGADAPTGTLTSPAFTVTKPWASYLIGGGKANATRVELIDDSGAVIHKASGDDAEDMRRQVVDLGKFQGKKLRIRLVDEGTGGWGHLNFDDFVFHAEKPGAAAVTGGGRQHDSAVLWHLGDNPAKPSAIESAVAQKTVADFKVSPGFQVELVAAEPDLHQPIAFAIDERGRMWVVEGNSYPSKRKAGEGQDRIVILADKDGDGRFETRTVFMEGLNLVSAIEVGFGGVWIGAAPEMLFIADRNHDDKPDGAPEVVLDGWGYQDTHETINSFTWGPDGWLYGNQGVFTHSNVGAPGTPDDKRTPLNAGVWRYQPVTKRFEMFIVGGSNQWGIDFNSVGDGFMTHCRSFWGGGGTSHLIRSGHYWNQVNGGYAPFISGNAPGFAPGVKNFLPAAARYDSGEGGAGKPGTNAVYGGHSHVGTMLYLGDNFPEIYRDHVFTLNLHGSQLNQQEVIRSGSGYEVFHAGFDILWNSDPTYLGVDLQYGPDGAVYISDWTDTQHCHTPREEQWNRSNGRMYRLSWAATYKPVKVDLGAMSDAQLVALHTHRNEWYVRQARHLLQARAADGKLDKAALAPLVKTTADADPVTALRALWTLHVTNVLDDATLSAAAVHGDDRVRAWAVQLATENAGKPRLAVSLLKNLAEHDSSATVRRALASALPFLDDTARWDIGAALATHGEDAGDRFLPKLLWQGIAPLCERDLAKALALAGTTPIGDLADSIRWFAARTPTGRALITADLAKAPQADAERRLRLLAFTVEKEASLPMPDGWAAAAARFTGGDAAGAAQQLSAMFGDQTVLAAQRAVLADDQAPLPQRQAAFALLKKVNDPLAVPIYVTLLTNKDFRSAVIPLVGGSNDPAVATGLLAAYSSLNDGERAATLGTLTSKAIFAKPLVDAVVAKTFPKQDITATQVRQLRSLNDATISGAVDQLWGKVNESPAAAKATMDRFKKAFREKPLWAYDAKHGKEVFVRVCSVCHQMNGNGGKIGPDLSGSWPNGVDYFIENIVDPNAVIGPDFQLNLISLKDGTVVSGMISEETDTTLVVRSIVGTQNVPKASVANRTKSPASMMPPGLLETLPEAEAIDLLKFLSSKP
jgi:putative membrane-bound dehydrogenase-like protein